MIKGFTWKDKSKYGRNVIGMHILLIMIGFNKSLVVRRCKVLANYREKDYEYIDAYKIGITNNSVITYFIVYKRSS